MTRFLGFGILIFIQFVFSHLSVAEGEKVHCECENYRSLYELEQKAEQINRVTEATTGFKSEIRRQVIPAICRDYFHSVEHGWSFEGRVVLQPVPAARFDGEGAQLLLKNYFDLREVLGGCGLKGCQSEEQVSRGDQRTSDFFSKKGKESMSDADYLKSVPYLAAARMNESDFRVLSAFTALTREVRTLDGLKTWGAQVRDRLTTEEKVLLMQLVGSTGSSIYDQDRRTRSMQLSSEVLSFEDLMKGMAAYHSVSSNNPKVGVCRDWAYAQAQVGEALGLRTLIVESSHSKEWHVNTIAVDPARPGKVYRVDWGRVSPTEGFEGASLLYQGASDVGLDYRVYDPNGKPLAVVPSHLGKVLDEVIGAGTQTRDPLGTSQSTLIRGEKRIAQGSEVSVFAAMDPTTARTVGLTFQTRWGESTAFPGKAGVAGFYQDRTTMPGTLSDTGFRGMGGVYIRAEQHATTEVHPTPQLTLKADGSVAIAAMGVGGFGLSRADTSTVNSQGKETYAGNVTQVSGGVTGDLYSTVDAAAVATYTNDRGVAEAKVGVKAELSNSNAQNVGSYTLLPNHTYARVSGQYSLTDQSKIGGTAAVDYNPAGTRGQMQLGYTYGNLGLRGGWSGAIAGEGIPIQDGSFQRANLGIDYRFQSGVLSVTGSSPLAGDGPAYFGLGYSGQFD